MGRGADIFGKLEDFEGYSITNQNFCRSRRQVFVLGYGSYYCITYSENRSNYISPCSLEHGKSPCFSEVAFLSLVGPDYQLSILPIANGL